VGSHRQRAVTAVPFPRVEAILKDGPLKGERLEMEPVEGRPPSTIDVPDDEGGSLRYCLAEWTQEGTSADYTFVSSV
jgi:hypothetical protein